MQKNTNKVSFSGLFGGAGDTRAVLVTQWYSELLHQSFALSIDTQRGEGRYKKLRSLNAVSFQFETRRRPAEN
jgi:hypothetical protein